VPASFHIFYKFTNILATLTTKFKDNHLQSTDKAFHLQQLTGMQHQVNLNHHFCLFLYSLSMLSLSRNNGNSLYRLLRKRKKQVMWQNCDSECAQVK